MNEVSIIINGVRYDAVISKEQASCNGCELKPICRNHPLSQLCTYALNDIIFKKSTKSFEK